MTGFRVHPNGAQGYFNVKPDLTTLGKVIGGGLPVGAFGGKKEIMQELAPDGPIYQAGTLSGTQLQWLQVLRLYHSLKRKIFILLSLVRLRD